MQMTKKLYCVLKIVYDVEWFIFNDDGILKFAQMNCLLVQRKRAL